MKWLDSCLVNRGVHLRATREKAWTLYHQSLLLNLSAMTTTTKSREASAIFALHMMKELVSANYAESKPAKPIKEEISENEDEVISYIAGYLLKKTRLNYATEVQVLTASQPVGLTSLMNRGGLTQANEDFISIVRELEVTFRQLDNKSVNFVVFNNAVCEQNIASTLFKVLEDVDSSVEKKEKFFVGIVHLFFTVRAHQKCRNQVERSIRLSKTSQKSKALRDSLCWDLGIFAHHRCSDNMYGLWLHQNFAQLCNRCMNCKPILTAA